MSAATAAWSVRGSSVMLYAFRYCDRAPNEPMLDILGLWICNFEGGGKDLPQSSGETSHKFLSPKQSVDELKINCSRKCVTNKN